MNTESWASLALVALVAFKPDWLVPLVLGGFVLVVFIGFVLAVVPMPTSPRQIFKRCPCCGKPCLRHHEH